MKKGVTIVDIAKKLNMSVSTVSKALNDNISISKITKERVKALADEWHYVPNEAARNFQNRKSHTIAIIIPDLLDQFYAIGINGIETVATKNNYHVIICQNFDNPKRQNDILQKLISSRIDGVIISVSKNTKDKTSFSQLEENGIPVVFFSRSIKAESFSSVSSDHEDGALKAINLLVKKGHNRIAHIMGPDSLLTSHFRHDAYKKALEKNGIEYDKSLVKKTDFSYESTASAVKSLYKATPPTAYFVFKSYIGIDVLQFLRSFKPKELKKIDVIGYGNLPLIKKLENKPIASIDETPQIMGIKAAELLFEKINNDSKEIINHPQSIVVPCTLILND